ncbi:hypothetical protein KCU93_g476, partial [Aureobasidium melanogenum]
MLRIHLLTDDLLHFASYSNTGGAHGDTELDPDSEHEISFPSSHLHNLIDLCRCSTPGSCTRGGEEVVIHHTFPSLSLARYPAATVLDYVIVFDDAVSSC